METARHVSPGLDALQAPEPAHGTTRHSSGRQDMDLRLVKQAGDFRAPIIRDERHMMTTFHKFDGNGMGRNHMTARAPGCEYIMAGNGHRSEEQTSELQSLMRISYAVFCLKKTKKRIPRILYNSLADYRIKYHT